MLLNSISSLLFIILSIHFIHSCELRYSRFRDQNYYKCSWAARQGLRQPEKEFYRTSNCKKETCVFRRSARHHYWANETWYYSHARRYGHVNFWEYKTEDTPTCISRATFIDTSKCRKIDKRNCGDSVVRLELNSENRLVKCPKTQKQRISSGRYIYQRLWGERLVCRDSCAIRKIYLGMDEKEDDFNRRIRYESCYDARGHRLVCNTDRKVFQEVGKDDLGIENY